MYRTPRQAYLINGPFHGTIMMINENTNEHNDIRVAHPPQSNAWKKSDPWEPNLKTGLYKLSGPLRYDPINHNLSREPISYYYEWVGWEN
jgi:hypothetical protein